MPQHDFFVDLHCHPTYKPFGRSFRMGTPGQASNRPGDPNSVWNYDPPGAGDKLLNFVKGLTRFSQANLTAAAYGRTGVMTVSLGSIEKGFFRTKLGTGALADLVSEFTAGLSVPRINHIQNMTDYFADLLLEWDFLLANNEKFTRIDGMNYAYSIVSSFQELEAVMDFNDSELEEKMRNPRHSVQTKIALVLSIEGLHVLNTGLDQPVSDADVLDKVKQIKTFDKAPFFVTFSHHFNNDLCGHARSLPPPLNRLCDQEKNIGPRSSPRKRHGSTTLPSYAATADTINAHAAPSATARRSHRRSFIAPRSSPITPYPRVRVQRRRAAAGCART